MVAPHRFEGLSVAGLAAGLAAGRFTSVELVEACRERISLLDDAFGAIRCLLADAPDEAAASDRRRRQGAGRGPLDGIPVVVKDNIDVAGLPTTAGSLALEHSVPERDAGVVRRLREAGAVLVAKTNLSELSNFLTEDMPSGYSSVGGQVLNPYDTALTPSGSSSGSAVAVALGMAPLALGTETDGSITSPSEHQSLVGVKPTLGLVSRAGIAPIAPSQDTAGPMARSTADAAALLAVLAGPDPADPATADARQSAAALAALRLGPGTLAGVPLAVVRRCADQTRPDRQACHDRVVGALAAAGAELVDAQVRRPDPADELAVLRHEFAPAFDAYLTAVGPHAPVRSLAQLAAWNRDHEGEALKFGQVHVEAAVAIDHAAAEVTYRAARDRDLAGATDALEEAMAGRAEAVVFPGVEGCGLAARAGWPAVVLPAGYGAKDRRPVGVLLVGRPWDDARLLELAHALERLLPPRRPPWEINPAAFSRFAG